MNLSGWLNKTIYVASVTGKDSWGKATYESPRPLQARAEEQRRMIRSANGEEAVSTTRIFTTSPVLLTDRVWLPGANTAVADAADTPLATDVAPDKLGAVTLYQVDL